MTYANQRIRGFQMNQKYDKVKIAKILIGAYAFCVMAFLLLLFWTNQRVVTVDVSECEIVTGDEIEYGFDKFMCEYGYTDIRGHAYEKGVEIKSADTAILAYDSATGLYYQLPTRVVKNTKLTKEADDGCNYDYAQFRAIAFLKNFPVDSKACIWYRVNGESKLIHTDQVIYHFDIEPDTENGSERSR